MDELDKALRAAAHELEEDCGWYETLTERPEGA